MRKAPQGNYFFDGGNPVDQNLFTVYQSHDFYCLVDSNGYVQVDSRGKCIRVNDEETNKHIQEMAADLSADYYQRQQIEQMAADLSEDYYKGKQVESMVTYLSEGCNFDQTQSQPSMNMNLPLNMPTHAQMPMYTHMPMHTYYPQMRMPQSWQFYPSQPQQLSPQLASQPYYPTSTLDGTSQLLQQSQTLPYVTMGIHDYRKHSHFDTNRMEELFGDSHTLEQLKYHHVNMIRRKKALDFYVSKDGESLIYFGNLFKKIIHKWYDQAAFIDVYQEDDILITTIKPKQPLANLKEWVSSKVSDSKQVLPVDHYNDKTDQSLFNYKNRLGHFKKNQIRNFFGAKKYLQAAKNKFISMNFADSMAYISADQTGIMCFLNNKNDLLRNYFIKNASMINLANVTGYDCDDDIICFFFEPKSNREKTVNHLISCLQKLGKTIAPISSVLDAAEFNPESMMQQPQQTSPSATTRTTTTTTTTTSYRVPNLFEELRQTNLATKRPLVDLTVEDVESDESAARASKHHKSHDSF